MLVAGAWPARSVLLGLLLVALAACGAADAIPGFDKFRKFELIYEPSGVQQLPDGRFVVVEDESDHPLDVFSLQADGEVTEQPLYRASLLGWISSNRVMGTLEDLEGLAADGEGRLYAITSHSRKDDGKRANQREQLVRFALDGEQIVDFQVVRGLRKAIGAQHESLKDAAKIRDVKDDGGFNIEGLAFDATGQSLLIGLRSPRAGDNAIIVVVENPQAMFDRGEAPRISDRLIELDLDGGGIRGLSYDPHLGRFLVIGNKPGKAFKLWSWSGDPGEPPKRLAIPHLKNLRQAESVTPVRVDGRPEGILIVSDDGNGLKDKPGHYLFLRYDQLVAE